MEKLGFNLPAYFIKKPLSSGPSSLTRPLKDLFVLSSAIQLVIQRQTDFSARNHR